MAEGDKLSIGIVQPMPKIFGVNGEEMALSDLRRCDILVVHWAEPAKYKAKTSVVRFEWPGENGLVRKEWIFLSRAESEPLNECCYPLKDISEMRFCAHDSSASAQVFNTLASLYKENRMLWSRVKRIEDRLKNLAA